MPSTYSRTPSLRPFLSPLHRVRFPNKQGKKGQKLIFLWSVLSYPRIFGDKKGQNLNIFLKVGRRWAVFGSVACLLSSCPLVASGQALGLVPSSGGVFRPFVSLLLLLSCNACEICPISRFKGVLAGFYGVCGGLYCFGALRGLWGFCVRE